MVRDHPETTLIQGDAQNAVHVAQTIAGCDRVAIVLGAAYNRPTSLHLDAVRHVLRAVQEQHAKGHAPIHLTLLTSTHGNAETRKRMSALQRAFFQFFLGEVYKDHQLAQEQLFAWHQPKLLTWTIVQPPGLVDAPVHGFATSTDGTVPLPEKGTNCVSYPDLAALILETLENAEVYGGAQVLVNSTLKGKMPDRAAAFLWDNVRRKVLGPAVAVGAISAALVYRKELRSAVDSVGDHFAKSYRSLGA